MGNLSLFTMPVLRILFILGICHITAWAASDERTCYFPNQNKAIDHVPCSSDEGSACCSTGAICLSNNLCLNVAQPYVLSRASCTDQSWLAGGCPQPCKDVTPDSSCTIELFTNKNGVINYCCNTIVDAGKNSTKCMSDKDPIEIDDSHVIPGRALLQDLTKTPPKKSHDVALGVGLGVPLGLIAITAMLWGFWERVQRRKLAESQAAMDSLNQNAVPVDLISPVPHSQEYIQKPPFEAPTFRHPVELEETVQDRSQL